LDRLWSKFRYQLNEDPAEAGTTLVELIDKSGKSRHQIVHETGIGRATLDRWIAGSHSPQNTTLTALKRSLFEGRVSSDEAANVITEFLLDVRHHPFLQCVIGAQPGTLSKEAISSFITLLKNCEGNFTAEVVRAYFNVE